MPIRIILNISDDDVLHFRAQLQKARETAGEVGEPKIIEAAEALVAKINGIQAPEFVRERLERLETLIGMVKDERWGIPADVRNKVLSALAYFVDPEDMIPDDVPGLGFLDDAIMIELIVRELRHEIEAFDDFCKFGRVNKEAAVSDAVVDSADFRATRERLRRRARRRSRRDKERSRGRPRSSLW